jgi:DNA-binding NarL/FixJ family response regulator
MSQGPFQRPSGRQLLIIEQVADGLTNHQIAQNLGISDQVIKRYVSEIYLKIGVSNRIGLALWYELQVHKGKLRRTLNRNHG